MCDRLLRKSVAWLEKERAIYEQVAKRLGIPLSLRVVHTVVTDIEDTSLIMEEREFSTSPMSQPETKFALSYERSQEPEDLTLAGLVHERWGDRCQVWTSPMMANFASEPVKWVQRQLLIPLLSEYLSGLVHLAHPDVQLGEKLVRDLFRLLDAPTIINVAVLPTGGITPARSSIRVDDVTLRRLSREELSDLAGDPQAIFRRGLSDLTTTVLHVAKERSALEVHVPVPKNAPHPADPGLFLHRIVVALELLGFELHGRGIVGARTDPGPRLDTHLAEEIRLRSNGQNRRCSKRQLSKAVEIARLVPANAIHQPRTRQEVAVHRFFLGAGEDSAADALIDFTIALEALLLPESFEGELSFRLALLGAHYVAKNRTERRSVYDQFASIYRMRSHLVHGLSSPSHSDIADAARVSRALAASSLLRALTEGWPSQAELKAALI